MHPLFIRETKEIFLTKEEANSHNQGIYNGNMGKAILSGILFKHTHDDFFNDAFQKYINEAGENIAIVKEVDFKNGIAGIGWGVEWLCQNKLLNDVNTDEVLEDFDDLLYKTIIHSNTGNFTLLNGEIGSAAYFILRTRSKNPGTHRFRKILNRECVTVLEDRVSEYLQEVLNRNLYQVQADDIIGLGDILKILSPSYNILDTEKESVLKNAFTVTDEILSGYPGYKRGQSLKEDPAPGRLADLLYLASALLGAAINVSSRQYQLKAKKSIKELILETNKNISLLTETEEVFKLLRIQVLLNLYCGDRTISPGLRNILFSIKDRMDTTISINDWVCYTLAQIIDDRSEPLYEPQDIIFYE